MNAECGVWNGEFAARGEDLKSRTRQFALRVIRLVETLPKSRTADVLGRQLLRAGTSVGANYRAERRARSAAEFRAKLGIVEEEVDETGYWIELLVETGLVKSSLVESLLSESSQLTAIIIASIKTSRRQNTSQS